MKHIQLFALAVFLLDFGTSISAQNTVQLSKPDLELKGNLIIISYEILQSSGSELYNIWIEVTNDNGNILNARSLRGDVGENIRGGSKRQIAWEYENDVVNLDAGIYVQVLGELMNPIVEKKVPEVAETLTRDTNSKTKPSLSMPAALLRSVVFPGWGLSALNPGKPHWLKGVAGYGAIFSSVFLNRMAVENYNKYLESSDQGEFIGYYDQAVNQQNISTISAYVALGIWVSDIVWTLLSDPGKSGYQSHSKPQKISFGSGFDPAAGAPMIAFRYNF